MCNVSFVFWLVIFHCGNIEKGHKKSAGGEIRKIICSLSSEEKDREEKTEIYTLLHPAVYKILHFVYLVNGRKFTNFEKIDQNSGSKQEWEESSRNEIEIWEFYTDLY